MRGGAAPRRVAGPHVPGLAYRTNGLPVHSFRTLLGDLATITKNRVVPQVPGAEPFEVLTRPTALQREAFMRLGVRLERSQ